MYTPEWPSDPDTGRGGMGGGVVLEKDFLGSWVGKEKWVGGCVCVCGGGGW